MFTALFIYYALYRFIDIKDRRPFELSVSKNRLIPKISQLFVRDRIKYNDKCHYLWFMSASFVFWWRKFGFKCIWFDPKSSKNVWAQLMNQFLFWCVRWVQYFWVILNRLENWIWGQKIWSRYYITW